jgi:predicted nucleic acid-binding protein
VCETPKDQPESWVVSHAYEGPNRRRRASWFSRRKVRLDDAAQASDPELEPTETLLRRVSLWTGLDRADRDQRAQYVATLEGLARKGRREGHRHWPEIIEASARYVRAAGASGEIDAPLLADAIHAASRAHYENGDAGAGRGFVKRLLDACRGRF